MIDKIDKLEVDTKIYIKKEIVQKRKKENNKETKESEIYRKKEFIIKNKNKK